MSAEMTIKTAKIPGSDHPITIESHSERVTVKVGGRVIADSADALALTEANYRPVLYIPPKDIDFALLERSTHTTYCPYKGDCSYYSIPSGGIRSVNAAWVYEAPFEAVAEIKDHLAFYPDRVDPAS
jgi:uncharacterized protein (DUF427 family)